MTVVFVVAASVVTPDYSHVSDTISQLGAKGRTFPQVMNIGLIVYGVLMSALTLGLYKCFGEHRLGKLFVCFVAINAVGVVAAATGETPGLELL